ncbi:hypothetical protein DFH09DRAFT_1099506 [Mycena vulgaris]|nr:hypothetical protein DFH09DRAFT_1099506 [Mycena vulgaris]
MLPLLWVGLEVGTIGGPSANPGYPRETTTVKYCTPVQLEAHGGGRIFGDRGSSGWLVVDLHQICEYRATLRKYPDAVFEVEVCAYEVFLEHARSWAAREAAGHPAQPTAPPPTSMEIPSREYSSVFYHPLGRLWYEGACPVLLVLGIKTDTQFTNIFTSERTSFSLTLCCLVYLFFKPA